MQILEQTHKYLEQIGAKVQIQKAENRNAGKDEDTMVDAYGNPIKKDEQDGQNEDSEDKDTSDAAKIKENLRNSSKIYYNITHSVKEDIDK